MKDETARKFDEWACNGKAEEMERGHASSVSRMLKSAKFHDGFSFLDVGCGNGWVVRRVALDPNCRKSVGIDKSCEMVNRAKSDPRITKREEYHCTDIENWTYRGRRFDYVFSMEAIYYSDSIEKALAKIYTVLKPGGVFLCGTDFYEENTGTRRWSAAMGITMHLLSKERWRELFIDAGFKTRLRHLKNPKGRTSWEREMGTLLITGIKCADPI